MVSANHFFQVLISFGPEFISCRSVCSCWDVWDVLKANMFSINLFHMKISFHMQMSQNSHVNKTNFHMKGFALGLALKQKRKATWKSPIGKD